MRESILIRNTMLAATVYGARLFRNNVGNGYVGSLVTVLPNGNAVLANWRRIQFGLAPGSSDLIGWTPVVITPDMVGRTLAVFSAIEDKTKNVSTTKMQKAFIEAVRADGGFAGVARSVDEGLAIIGVPNGTKT